MDKKYIELGQAKRALSDEAWHNPYFRQEEYAINVLNKLPAAEVAPVRHERWILKDDGRAHCSMCDTSGNSHVWNYCPNCGAKMDESEDAE